MLTVRAATAPVCCSPFLKSFSAPAPEKSASICRWILASVWRFSRRVAKTKRALKSERYPPFVVSDAVAGEGFLWTLRSWGPPPLPRSPRLNRFFLHRTKAAMLLNASFSFFASESKLKAASEYTSVRFLRARWFTKDCLPPGKSPSFIQTSPIHDSRHRSPFFTSAIPQTLGPLGLWHSRSVSSRTTEKSIPSLQIDAGR